MGVMMKGDDTTSQRVEEGGSCFSDPGSDGGGGPEKTDFPSYVVYECKTRAYNEGVKNCGVLCFTVLVLILCLVGRPFFEVENLPLNETERRLQVCGGRLSK